ncbi:MAG: DinB family protein [Gemmatimonadales bacterium]
MAMIDAMLMELNQEAQATRRLLERVPEDKLSWRPHPKSFSLGQIALHLAQLPGGVSTMAAQEVYELPQFQQQEAESRAEILQAFEQGLSTAREVLGQMDDRRLMGMWTLQDRGQVLMSLPRAGLLRSILLNHYYHHRGQLSVYLRLLNVPVPSTYGPTADENPFARPAVATTR